MTRARHVLCSLLLATLAPSSPAQDPAGSGQAVLLDEGFQGRLDTRRWERVRVHRARAERIRTAAGRLVLGVDTRGADDRTVELRGVRSRASFPVPERGPPLRVTVALDWNGQRNGSYLTAGLALLPVHPPRKGNTPRPVLPQEAPEALGFEFVGVPPGRNARPSLWLRKANGLRPLYTEGWPQRRREDRTGRRVGRTHVTLELTARRVVLREGGRVLYRGGPTLQGRVRLLLFVTSHSNYALRTVLFESVRVAGTGRGR